MLFEINEIFVVLYFIENIFFEVFVEVWCFYGEFFVLKIIVFDEFEYLLISVF